MSISRKLSIVLLSVLTCVCLAPQSNATGPYFAPALEIEMRPPQSPWKTGPVTLRMIITPTYRTKCQELNLEVFRLDNITDVGIRLIGRDQDTSHQTIYDVTCSIPSNDTSGLELIVRCGTDSAISARYWVNRKGQTTSFPANPRLFSSVLHPPRMPKILPADSVDHTPLPETVDSIRNNHRQ